MAQRGGPPPWQQGGGPQGQQIPPEMMRALQLQAEQKPPSLEQRMRFDSIQLAIAFSANADLDTGGLITAAKEIFKFVKGEEDNESSELQGAEQSGIVVVQ